jgi:1-phosphofructokinase family hexose kinase
MIVTLTPNTTLDHTLFIEAYVPNKTIRAHDSLYSMGGKPTDAAFLLGTLGFPVLALGFAAGGIGQKAEMMLRGRGVQVDFVPVEGESRLNTVLISTNGDHCTITTNTLRVLPEHIPLLLSRYEAALEEAKVVILGGTLPQGTDPSLYVTCIDMARRRQIPVIFDASEPNLSTGLTAQPTYIKPNQDELAGLVERPITTVDEAYHAGQEVLHRYGTAPIISLGGAGGLAVLPGKTYRIPALPIQVVSTAGAGDAVLAGMAAELWHGEPVETGLRRGFAAAAAVCLHPGTADCDPADVERFFPQIELIPYP